MNRNTKAMSQGRRGWRLLIGRSVMASLVGAAAVVYGAPPAAVAATLHPVADTYVESAFPNTNFGTKLSVRTSASPARVGYLKFDVTQVGARATLRVFATSDVSEGLEVHAVADTGWSESGMTYNNRPAVGALVGSTGPVLPNLWYTVDVTSAVTRTGLVAFALTSTGGGGSLYVDSREGGNPPELHSPAPPNPEVFDITSLGGDTYRATSPVNGKIYQGTLKFVGEQAAYDLDATGGGTVRFGAGIYDLGASYWELKSLVRVEFAGAGMALTTIRNNTSATKDTEPFNFNTTDFVVIRDLTVTALGALRSTSDAIDFDRGNHSSVIRVGVNASRARGVVFDGKGAGWTADHNTVRDCVIDGVPHNGIEFLASSNNIVEGCTVRNVTRHGIQIAKASTLASQPNKTSNDNIVRGNVIDNSGLDGINLNGGDRNLITGNQVTNSSDDTSGRDGIRLGTSDGIACDDNRVEGNSATDNQQPKTQRYGLAISSSLCHRSFVSGNQLAGNLKGDLLDLGTGTVVVTTTDGQAPTVPGGVTATAASSSSVTVAWNASSDTVGVTGYTVYRNGASVGTALGGSLSFSDTAVQPSTTYGYTVDAFDAAGNHSAASSPAVQVTTPAGPPGPAVRTFLPTADTYVNAASPASSYGNSTALRVDGSPDVHSYLRFTVQGLAGAPSSAVLRIWANSASNTGFQASSVGGAWSEATTYGDAPPVGAVIGSGGPHTGGLFIDIVVTSQVTGNGTYDLALTTTSSTAISLSSSEGLNPPQLVVTTG